MHIQLNYVFFHICKVALIKMVKKLYTIIKVRGFSSLDIVEEL